MFMKLFGGHGFGTIHSNKMDLILPNTGCIVQTRATLSGEKSGNMHTLSPDSRSQMDEVLRFVILIVIHAEGGSL